MCFLHNSTAFLLLLFAVFALTSSINSQAEPTLRHKDCYGTTGTANASFNSNLASLFESFLSKASQNYSFYNDNSNIGIYGLYLCRGDVSNESCKSCISSATLKIINLCPSSTEAIIYGTMSARYGMPKLISSVSQTLGHCLSCIIWRILPHLAKLTIMHALCSTN